MPRQGQQFKLCKRGHELAVFGRNGNGACRECQRIRGRRWAAANRSKMYVTQREWVKKNPIRAAWQSYKTNAKQRNVLIGINYDEFERLSSSPCHYCGAIPAPINGVDRVDNAVGYYQGNVVPCCTVCNLAKRNLTLEEFINWGLRLGRHLFERIRT